MQDRRAGFDEFVTAQGTRLLRAAYLLTGEQGAAEDLLQDVLERVFVAWPRIEDPLAYTRSALARRAANRWRLRGRHRETDLLEEHEPSVEDGSSSRALRDELLLALRQLPPRQRAVLVLRYYEDLSEHDTAETLGISRGTVKSQASRGLTRLRDVLGPAIKTATQEEEPCHE